MYEGKWGFWCPKIGCRGFVKKEKVNLPRKSGEKDKGKSKKGAKKTHERKARPR